MKRLVVLISGSGSNLQAIIDACHTGVIDASISAVICNKAGVMGLDRARKAGLEAVTLPHTDYANRDAFDAALAERIESYQPDLVVLAGFMRILTDIFVKRFVGRMINIHPSLLPAYPGLNTHQRAIDAGDTVAGASVHFVTPELDGGPVIAQRSVPIAPGDDANALARKVLAEEHRLYPEVIRWFVDGRLTFSQGKAWLDHTELPANGKRLETTAA
ncbi:MAG: phosphoribosylglycinamide formyltransferase [Saccharospirillum sp.]